MRKYEDMAIPRAFSGFGLHYSPRGQPTGRGAFGRLGDGTNYTYTTDADGNVTTYDGIIYYTNGVVYDPIVGAYYMPAGVGSQGAGWYSTATGNFIGAAGTGSGAVAPAPAPSPASFTSALMQYWPLVAVGALAIILSMNKK